MIFLLIALLLGGGYVGYKKFKKSQTAKAAPSPPVAAPPKADPFPIPPALPPVEELPKGVEIVHTDDAGDALVSFDPVRYGAKFAGQLFAVWPMRQYVSDNTLESATLEWNCGEGRIADANPNWFYARVNRMLPNGLGGFQPQGGGNHGEQWIANAWTVGSDNDTWDAVIDHLQNHWQLPTNNGPGSGFVPGH